MKGSKPKVLRQRIMTTTRSQRISYVIEWVLRTVGRVPLRSSTDPPEDAVFYDDARLERLRRSGDDRRLERLDLETKGW